MKHPNYKLLFTLPFLLSLLFTTLTYATGLNGSYTIDKSKAASATNYTSFNDADSDLIYGTRSSGATANGPGVTTSVTFNVADGIYQEQLKIGKISGVSATNTITFQGHTGDSTKVILMDSTLGAATGSYVVYLDSANYIHFNEITFNKAYGSTYDVAINMDYSNHNSFDNCQILGPPSNTSQTYALVYSSTKVCEFNAFRNNYLKNGSAYYTFGYFTTSAEKGNVISNNYIDTSYLGIIAMVQDSLTIVGNRMTIVNGTAIYLSDMGMTSFKGNISLIANNSIFLTGLGTFGQFTLYGCDNANIAYNNIDNYGTTSGTGLNFAIFLGNVTSLMKAGNMNLYNNNFVNHNNGVASVAIYTSNYNFTKENNNNLYSGGPYLVSYNGTNYTNLNKWKSAGLGFASKDISIDPFYFKNPNLSIYSPLLYEKGTPLSVEKYDINGVTRDASTPNIGAFEFTPPALDNEVIGIVSPQPGFCAGTKDVYVRIGNGGSATITSATIEWSVNGVKQTAYSWTGSLASGDTTSINVGSYSFSNNVSYKIVSYPSASNGSSFAADSTNTDSAIVFAGLNGGAYTIDPAGSGSANYVSFRAAVDDLNSMGLCGAVTYYVADGIYNESVKIGPIPGASVANTVVFQSKSLDPSKVELDTSWAASGSYVLDLDYANYVSFRYMTITDSLQLYLENSYVVLLSNTSSHNTLEHNIIYAPSGYSSFFSSVIGDGYGTLEQYNTIRNNRIYGGDVSVFFEGAGTGISEFGNVISGNILDSASIEGIEFDFQDSLTITGNSIFTLAGANTGIVLFVTDGYGSGKDSSMVSNNFISCDAFNGYGLVSAVGSMLDVYNNSIVSSSDSSSTYATALFIAPNGSVNIRNNIFVNLAGGRALYSLSGSLHYSDYNDMYSPLARIPMIFNGTNCATLSDWKKASKMDAHSVTVDPAFVSDTTGDLHLTNISTGVIGKGFTLSSVSVDIDGDKRPLKNPDMGADQFVMDSNDVGVALIINPKNNDCGNANTIVAVQVKNFGLKNQTTLNVHVKVQNSAGISTATKAISKSINGFISSGANADTEYISFIPALNTLAGGTYTIKAYTDLVNDSNHKNDTITATLIINPQPKAGFSVKNTCIGSIFTVTDTSKNAGTCQYYLVNNSGLKIDSSTSKNPSNFTAFSPGYYRIWQKVQSTGSCSDTTSVALKIDTINAHFTHSVPLADGTVNFKAADTTLNSYSWNFGDGTAYGASYSQSHKYIANGTYHVVLTATSSLGCIDSSKDSVTVLISGINEANNSNYVEVYPNPFRESTNIEYSLGNAASVKVVVSDVFGRVVATLVHRYTIPGDYKLVFNASDYNHLSPGIYIIRITMGDIMLTREMTLVK